MWFRWEIRALLPVHTVWTMFSKEIWEILKQPWRVFLLVNGWPNVCRIQIWKDVRMTCRLLLYFLWLILLKNWDWCWGGCCPNPNWRKERISGYAPNVSLQTRFRQVPIWNVCMHSVKSSEKETGKHWPLIMKKVFFISSIWPMRPKILYVLVWICLSYCLRMLCRCHESITGCCVRVFWN